MITQIPGLTTLKRNDLFVFLGGLFMATCWYLHASKIIENNYNSNMFFLFLWLICAVFLFMSTTFLNLVTSFLLDSFFDKRIVFKVEKELETKVKVKVDIKKFKMFIAFKKRLYGPSSANADLNNYRHLFSIVVLSILFSIHPSNAILQPYIRVISWSLFSFILNFSYVLLFILYFIVMFSIFFFDKLKTTGIIVLYDGKKLEEEIAIAHARDILNQEFASTDSNTKEETDKD